MKRISMWSLALMLALLFAIAPALAQQEQITPSKDSRFPTELTRKETEYVINIDNPDNVYWMSFVTGDEPGWTHVQINNYSMYSTDNVILWFNGGGVHATLYGPLGDVVGECTSTNTYKEMQTNSITTKLEMNTEYKLQVHFTNVDGPGVFSVTVKDVYDATGDCGDTRYDAHNMPAGTDVTHYYINGWGDQDYFIIEPAYTARNATFYLKNPKMNTNGFKMHLEDSTGVEVASKACAMGEEAYLNVQLKPYETYYMCIRVDENNWYGNYYYGWCTDDAHLAGDSQLIEPTYSAEGSVNFVCDICGNVCEQVALPVRTEADGSENSEPVFLYQIHADNSVTITGCMNEVARVTIPADIYGCPVRAIASGAFAGWTKLREVTIPGSVETIGDRAFLYCPNLMNISFENGLRRIGDFAFAHCTSLTTVDFPRSFAEIGACAFDDCTVLQAAILPESLQKIGRRAFSGCRALPGVYLSDAIAEMGAEVFRGCSSLRYITVHQGSYAEEFCKENNLPCNVIMPVATSVPAPTAAPQPTLAVADEFANVRVGKVITFGSYRQGTTTQKTPIEWIVLAVEEDRILVLSRYCLEAVKYNNWAAKPMTWEKCTLRAYLNNEFIHAAFSETEKQRILWTELENADTGKVDGGPNTQDRVFLLSLDEVYTYMPNNTYRAAEPTQYAVKQGAYTNAMGQVWWWLRSPGEKTAGDVARAAGIYGSGSLDIDGTTVNFKTTNGMRPAMWINILK